jgi:hypothetical protein
VHGLEHTSGCMQPKDKSPKTDVAQAQDDRVFVLESQLKAAKAEAEKLLGFGLTSVHFTKALDWMPVLKTVDAATFERNVHRFQQMCMTFEACLEA